MKYTVPFVNYGAQYRAHKEEYDDAIQRCLNNGDLILRDEVERFEQNLVNFVGTKYAVGVNSGTDALHLSLRALGVRGKVRTRIHTFKATWEAIEMAGCGVVFNGDASAFIPVHLAGKLDMDRDEWRQYPVIVEDACQGLGNESIGQYSQAAAFSFYPAKILGSIGDGGAVVTNNKDTADKVRSLRDHCRGTGNMGYNSRLDNINAAFLNVKIKYLPEILKRRKKIAELYDNALAPLQLVGIKLPEAREVYQDYIIVVSQRDELYEYLQMKNIETMKDDYGSPTLGLRLPCNETLADGEIEYVAEQIRQFVDREE